jgi:hypothetical protein
MQLPRTPAVLCILGLLVVVPLSAKAQEEAAPPSVTGSLSVEAVRKVLKADHKKLRKCYDDSQKAKPGLAGQLTVKWTVGTDGAVSGVAVEKKASTIDDSALIACVTGVIKAWKFPKLDAGSASVLCPLRFGVTSAAGDDEAAASSAVATNTEKAKRDSVDKPARALAEAAGPAAGAPGSSAAASPPAAAVGGARSESKAADFGGGSGKKAAPAAPAPAPSVATAPERAPAPKTAHKPTAPAEDGVAAAAPKGEPAAEPVRAAPRVVDAPAIKAGRYDDNKQYNRFLEFLRENTSLVVYPVDIGERLVLRTLDKNGKSLPNCSVEVKSLAGKLLSSGVTYADGSTQFFPRDAGAKSDKDYTISATCGQATRQGQLSREGRRVTDLRFDFERALPPRIPVDIAIVIDTTGSMQSQIDRLKKTLQSIHYALTQLSTKPDIRFGLVAYRDRGDDYVTQVTPFTDSVDAFQAKLDKLEADGGGDTPEDMQSALEKAMGELAWRSGGIRLGFVISDAPPHTDYGQKYTYAAAMRDGLKRGVKWITVGAGGLSRDGEVIFRQISQFTMGEYVFITESGGGDTDGGAGEASHHVGSNYATENLDQAIVRIVRRELSYLTDEPRDFDYTISASGTKATPRDEVLAPAVAEVLRQLADYSAIKLAAKTPVAVIPVAVNQPSYADVGGYLSDQMILSATRNPSFKVVERDLKALAQEQKLQLSDLFDVTETVPFGKLVGAEALIVAKLNVVGDGAELYAKLVRVETGEVLSAAKVKVTGVVGGS